MSILNKYKRWNHVYTLIKDRYFDFVLSMFNGKGIGINGNLTEKCLSAYIDLSDKACYEDGRIVSKEEYMWDGAVNDGAELKDIGFTGMDNGLIKFDKDAINDEEFLDLLTRSEMLIPEGDMRLHMDFVSGNTKQFSYEICEYYDYIGFKGGFLQGFYKLDGFDYQILPNSLNNDFVFEFVLRPRNYITKNNTLNSFYPENKGIFFYMGTRAENKFAKEYMTDLSEYEDRNLSGVTTCDNYFLEDYIAYSNENSGTTIDSGETTNLSGMTIVDSEGDAVGRFPLGEIETDNKFLFINRSKSGFTYPEWDDEKSQFVLQYDKRKLKDNLFLIMNRSKNGLTYRDKDKLLEGEYKYVLSADTIIHVDSAETVNDNYDIKKDIYNNAFALKLNNDGSVGYRYLVKDCDSSSGYTILEENTFSGMVENDKWSTISVRIRRIDGHDDNCGNPVGKQKMKIFIYINGYLKLVSKELDAFDFHRLDDIDRRQETVPFNISLGGGTQGLAESIWVNYKEVFEKVLPLEKNFAGTFIGDIKKFRMYTCALEYNEIKNNYLFEKQFFT